MSATFVGPLEIQNNLAEIKNAGTAAQAAARESLDVASNSEALLRSGGTMTGELVLAGDPTNSLDATTKSYTDAGDASNAAAAAAAQATAGAALPLSGGTMTGSAVLAGGSTATTQTAIDNSTLIATTAFVQAVLSGAIVGLHYQGTWNASTNTPTLASGVGTRNFYYLVSVAGSTTLDGISSWAITDFAIFNGSVWQRVQSSGLYGSMALQAAAAVAITGGSASLSLLSIATDPTKALQIAPDDTLPADVRFADEYGFVGVSIEPDGSLSLAGALSSGGPVTAPAITATTVTATTVTGTTVTATNISQNQVSLPNTTLLEVADGTSDIIVQDDFGFVAFAVYASGLVAALNVSADAVTANTYNMPAGLILSSFTITESTDGLNDLWFSDDFGFASLGISGTDGSISGLVSSAGGGTSVTAFSSDEIIARDALATARSMAVRDDTNSKVATPIWTYNLIISYGQSLSLGNAGGSPLSTASGLDNLCLGTRCVGTQATLATVFTPATDGNFHSLDGNTFQEPPGIGATNQWRALQLRLRGLASDSTRRLVFNCAGEGAQSIEQLSKGATPNLYNKIPSLITQCMSAAASAGGTFGVVAIYYVQGEANYTGGGGWDNTESGYLAKLDQLRSDISADVMALTGQKLPPVFLTVQTNSFWDHSGDISAIGLAQLDAATTAPTGDYLTSPNYQANTDIANSGHLSNDGYRWIGNQAGHILHKTLDKGEGWLPLYPTGATCRDTQILLSLHTPEPPLQLQPFYGGSDGSTPQPIFADCGFRAGDDAGQLTISSVTLYNSVILITCDRSVIAANHPWIQYADNTVHGGNGNVCDSDPFSSLDVFSSGTPASVGQPYPGFNWLVAFRINVVSDV